MAIGQLSADSSRSYREATGPEAPGPHPPLEGLAASGNCFGDFPTQTDFRQCLKRPAEGHVRYKELIGARPHILAGPFGLASNAQMHSFHIPTDPCCAVVSESRPQVPAIIFRKSISVCEIPKTPR